YASVNFVTCHDGFTLHDLVGYNQKHNEANGEDSRDGTDDNNAWNCGAEGPSEDAEIVECRERRKRAFLATLFFSQGVSMLLAVDDLFNTQGGNNNAYCQDKEITWLDWELDQSDQYFLVFVKQVRRLWQTQPVLQRRKWFQNRSIRGT